MLTLKMLKAMPPHTIFAQGELVDSPEDCNLANTGKTTRWVAVRGGIHDWAIYAQNPHYIDCDDLEIVMIGYSGIWDWGKISREGDKISTKEYIRKLVECDDESFKRYNY